MRLNSNQKRLNGNRCKWQRREDSGALLFVEYQLYHRQYVKCFTYNVSCNLYSNLIKSTLFPPFLDVVLKD